MLPDAPNGAGLAPAPGSAVPVARKKSRVLPEWQGRLLLTFYPPLFFQRVRCVSIGPGYRTCRMSVAKTILTKNLNGTTFGGTIFSAADPVYALLYWQIFAREQLPVQVWLKSASAEYRKPAATQLTLDFAISEADLADARTALRGAGKWIRNYRTEARDRTGDVCAVLSTEVFMRIPRAPHHAVSGF